MPRISLKGLSALRLPGRMTGPLRTSLATAVACTALYYLLVAAGATCIYRYNLDTGFTRAMGRAFPYPAAVADGRIIPLARYRKEVAALEFVQAKNADAATPAALRSNVMDRLTDNVLYADALSRSGRSVTDADTDAFLRKQADQIGGTDNLVKFVREEYGGTLSYDDFRTVTKELLVRSLIEKEVLLNAHVYHILIAVPQDAPQADVDAALKRAEEVKAKISDPSQFGDIAKQYSEDIASRDKGGELGTTSRGQLAEEYSQAFEDALFNLPVGRVSDPIRSNYGWHLILIDKKQGVINESLDHYTAQLREAARIHVFVKL